MARGRKRKTEVPPAPEDGPEPNGVAASPDDAAWTRDDLLNDADTAVDAIPPPVSDASDATGEGGGAPHVEAGKDGAEARFIHEAAGPGAVDVAVETVEAVVEGVAVEVVTGEAEDAVVESIRVLDARGVDPAAEAENEAEDPVEVEAERDSEASPPDGPVLGREAPADEIPVVDPENPVDDDLVSAPVLPAGEAPATDSEGLTDADPLSDQVPPAGEAPAAGQEGLADGGPASDPEALADDASLSEEQGAPDEAGDGDDDGDESQAPEADALPLDAVVEALLFAARSPLTAKQLARAVRKGQRQEEIVEVVRRLNAHYLETERAFEIAEIAGKFQLYSRPEYAAHVRALFPRTESTEEAKDRRLTPAALDTLSIIAYKQPVTRAEVKDVRGVESDAVIRVLLERGSIKVVGRRADVVGQPVLYGTTEVFLAEFGLASLEQLPAYREMRRQLGLDAVADDASTPSAGAPDVEDGDGAQGGDEPSPSMLFADDGASSVEASPEAEAEAAEDEAATAFSITPASPGPDDAPKATTEAAEGIPADVVGAVSPNGEGTPGTVDTSPDGADALEAVAAASDLTADDMDDTPSPSFAGVTDLDGDMDEDDVFDEAEADDPGFDEDGDGDDDEEDEEDEDDDGEFEEDLDDDEDGESGGDVFDDAFSDD